MGMLIKEILDADTLHTLTSNSDPKMIRDEQVTAATMKFLKAIKQIELYPDHQALIDRFKPIQEKQPAIYAHRTSIIWKMSQAVFELMSLQHSDADFLRSNVLKCQGSFLSVLFDDIGDLSHDKAVFEKCILALNGQIDQSDVEFYTLVAETWSTFQQGLKQAPNYAVLKPVLEDAFQTWIASFKYSLLTEEELSQDENRWEKYVDIVPHTAMLYLAGLVDLLFVPNLSEQQISVAAQIFLRSQTIVQIFNWLTTWSREVSQRDFSSGLFILALENGWITQDELKNGSSDEIKQKIRNSPAEKYLWDLYEKLCLEIHQVMDNIQLPGLQEYVGGISAIMYMCLASVQEFSNY